MRRNVIFERARFNRCTQQQGESAEDYITVLHQLVDTSEYGDIKQEMIHDRVVVCIRDKSLSERLQMESDLTLEKAKKLIRQSEAVQQQQGILKSSNETLESVHKMKTNRFGKAVPIPQPVVRQPIPYPMQKCADDVEKLHTLGSHVWLKRQLVFAAIEKVILDPHVYQKQ